MAYTVIWYGKQGILKKTPFDAEKAARDHALEMFADRKSGVVAVEVRKDDGTVVFSKAGGAKSPRHLREARADRKPVKTPIFGKRCVACRNQK